MDATWRSLAVFMHNLIHDRQAEIRSSVEDSLKEGDIFSRLVAALDEDAKVGLSEQDVVGLFMVGQLNADSLVDFRLVTHSP